MYLALKKCKNDRKIFKVTLVQIFISQRTDFHFAKDRFHFVSFRFVKYNKPENSMRSRAVVRDPFLPRENA